MPLVKCACTSMMKYSLFGHFSSMAASSKVSASSTSKTLPYTRLEARKQVARPIELAMNARRSMLSFCARVVAHLADQVLDLLLPLASAGAE